MSQTTSHILMIRPVNFGFNAETAVNNAFQVAGAGDDAQAKAQHEFDSFVKLLCDKEIDVQVVHDTPEPHTPDSIFPNNWISFHQNGTIILYPMFAANRRKERKPGVIEQLRTKFAVSQTIDLSTYESENRYLEGTGSMVLDRQKHIAYACLSPRTDKKVLEDFCRKMNYKPMLFTATDDKQQPIYHTNVMMCVGNRFVVICLDAIPLHNDREMVVGAIKNSGKELIDITQEQMNHFAGNMLQVENRTGEKFLVMSTQAYNSLTPVQLKKLQSYNFIVHAPLDTIETNGGGSARCMMAEIFLPVKS